MAKKQCIRPAPVSSEISTNDSHDSRDHVPPSVMASAIDSAVQHASPASEAIDLVSPSVAPAVVHLSNRVQDVSADSDEIVLASPVVASPAPVVASPVVNHPEPNLLMSPGSNRQRFMASCQPLKVCCDLRNVGLHAAGVRFSFQAVVFVVYPASEKPDRRHVLLVDQFGCTGLTVWGAHVPLFTFATVGTVVKFTKLGMVVHNGKKALSMGKDTTIVFMPSSCSTEESKWWQSFSDQPFKRIIDIHDCEDNDIVNVAGIVGSLTSETKRVRSDNKDLMNMRLTDSSGYIDVRSWNHSEEEFKAFLEKPLLLQRVRVTSFAGIKVLEMLDGNGTAVVPQFVGAEELAKYWVD
jgi:hypothetical protein